MGEKLGRVQKRALSFLAGERHGLSHDGLHVEGISGRSMRALERRGYVTATEYANGVHFAITPAGRLALKPGAQQ